MSAEEDDDARRARVAARAAVKAQTLAGLLWASPEHRNPAWELKNKAARRGVESMTVRPGRYVFVRYQKGGGNRFPDAFSWDESVRLGTGTARILQAEAAVVPGGDSLASPSVSPRSCDRIRAALASDGTWPGGTVTIRQPGLTYSEMHYAGSWFQDARELELEGGALDLAFAAAILAASGQVPPRLLRGTVFLARLAADGTLHAPQDQPTALKALGKRFLHARPRTVMVASDDNDLAYCDRAPGTGVHSAETLAEVRQWLHDETPATHLWRGTSPRRPRAAPSTRPADASRQAGRPGGREQSR